MAGKQIARQSMVLSCILSKFKQYLTFLLSESRKLWGLVVFLVLASL